MVFLGYVFQLEKKNHLEQPKRRIQVLAKWHEGIFFGIKDKYETIEVRTPFGFVLSRSVLRVPKEDSGDWVLLISTRGVP